MNQPQVPPEMSLTDCAVLPTYVELDELIACPEALACIAEQSAIRLDMLPVAIWPNGLKPVLILACDSRADNIQSERIAQLVDYRYQLHLVPCASVELGLVIKRLYAETFTSQQLLEMSRLQIDQQAVIETVAEYPVHLVNALILQAVRMGASDLHFSPQRQSLEIRVRVDGVLLTLACVSRSLLNSLLVRIKIMATLDIAETRLPQDGQFRRIVDGHNIDCRVSSFPTVAGENTVIRLINAQKQLHKLSVLNLPQQIVEQLCSLVHRPAGLVVFCGPTGAGKSTTLFALLEQLDHSALSVMTLEDPVEQRIEGIRQTSIDVSRQWGYAQALRALLRQDPDVLLVGEIRDTDSCRMVLRAVSTGHQVLTTVHANDVHGALHRLQDLHTDNSALALGLSGLVAQRLLRCLCVHCKDGVRGCETCFGTGYQGRQVVMEVLEITSVLKSAIMRGESIDELHDRSIKSGFVNMRSMAMQMVRAGITDVQEVNRVLGVAATF